MTYVRTRVRNSYSSMMANSFLNEKTGNFKQLNKSPWFLKMKDGKPGYYLKMDNKFQQMPEACFKATTARSSTLSLKDAEGQIEDFYADNLGFLEVKNENN
jgi:hypothetical protein